MKGWVKIHRSILEWEWYDDVNVRALFLHLIVSANHSPKKWRGITIETGQLWTSIKSLSVATGQSEKQVRNSLKKLEKTNEIILKGASKGTMITVCKYTDYQGVTDSGENKKGKRGASERQAVGKQGATNKNEKNEKNEKKVYIPTKSDVIDYFVSNGYRQDAAERAYDYYESGTPSRSRYWKDSRGNPVKNWKQKMRGVWFKEENESKDDNVPVLEQGWVYVGLSEAYDIIRDQNSVSLSEKEVIGAGDDYVRKMMNMNPSYMQVGDGWKYKRQ